MRELVDIFGWVMLFGGLFGLAVIGLAIFAIGFLHCWRIVRRDWANMGKAAKVIALFAVGLATMYGGSKSITGRVNVNDPYITDSGSYITNDFIHVSVAKRYAYLPDTMSILVFVREVASTNVEDWTELLPRHTYADCPFDIPLSNATNYNALVAADYVPEPTVHTNGVWQIKGFVIPNTAATNTPGAFAFPNTRTRLED